jgi:hypothetical protein
MFHKMILAAVATMVATSAFAANTERAQHERDHVDAAQAAHVTGAAAHVNSDAKRMAIASQLSAADNGVLQTLVANRAFANDAAAQAGLDRVLLRASKLVGTKDANGNDINESQALELALNEINSTTEQLKESCK